MNRTLYYSEKFMKIMKWFPKKGNQMFCVCRRDAQWDCGTMRVSDDEI